MRESLPTGFMAAAGSAAVEWRISDAAVAYEDALRAMDARVAAIAAGTSTRPEDLHSSRFPVYEAGRGGQLTYHGPGQRVAYVMLDLRRRTPDVRRFVATLEEWLIQTLDAFNVRGERREDRVGVWVKRPDKGQDLQGGAYEDKIAALGIRIRQWVTLHGISLNVEPDLTHFSGIVPCGISEQRYGVTSLADLGLTATMDDVDTALRRQFERLFGATVTPEHALTLS